MRTTLVSILVLTSIVADARADGTIIPLQAARQAGRMSFTGVADDPAAVFYNPGGIGQIEGFALSVGAMALLPMTTYTDPNGNRFATERELAPLPNVYATWAATRWLSVGLAMNTPYGLSSSYPAAVGGAPFPGRTAVLTSTMATFNAIGVLCVTPFEGFSIAVGPVVDRSILHRTSAILLGDSEGRAEFGGTAWGVGATAGALWRPTSLPQLRVGLAYRSRIAFTYHGNADFDGPASFARDLPPDGRFTHRTSVPDQLAFGVSYDLDDDLNVGVDVTYNLWEPVARSSQTTFYGGPGSADDFVARTRMNWRNTLAVAVGGEHRFESFTLRLGYAYAQGAVPHETLGPDVVDPNIHVVTAGASRRFDAFTFDLMVGAVLPASRTAAGPPGAPALKGSYEQWYPLAGLAVRYAGGLRGRPGQQLASRVP